MSNAIKALMDKRKRENNRFEDIQLRKHLNADALCWRIAWFTNRLLKECYGKNLSFFKAFKTLMHDMHRLERLIVDGAIPAVEYYLEFLKLSSKKHVLEKKKDKSFSPEVFSSSLSVGESEILTTMLDS